MDDGRWATFDCYGTLIDWNGGISSVLTEVFGEDEAPRLLERYHQLEQQLEAESYRSYREVLDLCLAAIAKEQDRPLANGARHRLSQSLAEWPASPRCRLRWVSFATAAGSWRSCPTATAS